MVVAAKVRAREFEINWRTVLPPQLAPDIKTLKDLITAQLHGSWKQGTMLYETGFNTRIYKFLMYDEASIKSVLGKVIKYDAADKKSYSVKIQEYTKPLSKYKNPKNLTIVGTQNSDLVLLENAGFDEFFGTYGNIINETQDVYHRDDTTFTTGKKRLRIDLEMEIPRQVDISIVVDDGRTISGRVKVFYNGQKYFCRRCDEHHVGDCPAVLLMKEERANAAKVKSQMTETVFIGDSNLRHLNENAMLAEGVCVSGAKIGHIANQVKFQQLEKRSCVVLSAGTNNIVKDLTEEEFADWYGQLSSEMKMLEGDLKEHVTGKSRSAIITEVPSLPFIATKIQKKQRATINTKFKEMAANLKKGHPASPVTLLPAEDNLGSQFFEDSKHISPKLMEMICAQVNAIKNIRSPSLKGTMAHEKAYASVGTAYPMGCALCTKLNHHPNDCRAKLGSGLKRHHSDGDSTSISPSTKAQKSNNSYVEVISTS